MKKCQTILLILCMVMLCISGLRVYSQDKALENKSGLKAIDRRIADLKSNGRAFPVIELFESQGTSVSQVPALEGALNDGALLSLNKDAVQSILKNDLETLTLSLPLRGQVVELELAKVNLYTSDFTVITSSSGGKPVDYERGAHYRGVVKGEPNSLAAISVFNDEVMGLYSTPNEGNFVLGRLEGNNPNNDHILYAEKDLKSDPPYTCETKDDQVIFPLSDLQDPQAVTATKCVRIYVEADYDIFQNKGSVTNATNYVTGVFNQSAILYNNESIPTSLSQVFVWSSPSPYTGTSSSTLLSQFQANRNSFNGDIGHLLAFRGGGGIAAGFNAFCNSNPDNRQCFSGISSTFNNVPTYSWTVNVFTHEMGHLMGSRHTHACVWNGNGTAIDGCANRVEGTCPLPGYPQGGGTIMSYCHLSGRPGINFTLGFGPQPGNVLRNRFNSATCLIDCGGGTTTVFEDNFETDKGWTTNPSGTDTAATGHWERGDPEATNSSGPKQLGTSVSGVNNLVTARLAGSSAGANDIDGGMTSVRSPAITLPSTGSLVLSFSHYLAHGSNSSSADFLRVRIVSGSTTTTVFQKLGAAVDVDGVWAAVTASLNAFAGQTVRILIEAADASGASLVEAGIDDIRITQQ